MGHQVIKQPNGKFSLWSSIVDDFIGVNLEPKEIVEHWNEADRERNQARMDSILKSIESNGRPYHQFTMTVEDALEQILEVHGKERAEEVRKDMKL